MGLFHFNLGFREQEQRSTHCTQRRRRVASGEPARANPNPPSAVPSVCVSPSYSCAHPTAWWPRNHAAGASGRRTDGRGLTTGAGCSPSLQNPSQSQSQSPSDRFRWSFGMLLDRFGCVLRRTNGGVPAGGQWTTVRMLGDQGTSLAFIGSPGNCEKE